jgi:hypothetical protein
VLEWSWLALLGGELRRTIRTQWLCALAEAENVDLLVWISKCAASHRQLDQEAPSWPVRSETQ